MADTTFGLSTIGQVALSVGDIDRATEFYRDVLGMKFLFRAPPGLAFFDCAGVRLMLAAPEPESDEPPLSGRPIYFTVPDVSEAYETLKARGVEFVHKPQIIHSSDTYELWMAFFRDLDENLLAVMAEVGK